MTFETFVPRINDREQRAKDQGLLLFNPGESYKLINDILCDVSLRSLNRTPDGRYQWELKIADNQEGPNWYNNIWDGKVVLPANLADVKQVELIPATSSLLPVCQMADVGELVKLSFRLAREIVLDLHINGALNQIVKVQTLYVLADRLQPLVMDALKTIMTV